MTENTPQNPVPAQPDAKTPSYNIEGQASQANKTPAPLLEKLLQKKAPDGTAGKGNAFTKLFGASVLGGSLKNPATKTSGGLASTLGPVPRASFHKLDEQETKRRQTAKTVLYLSVLIGVCVYLFFYSQLNPNFTLLNGQFGPNVAQRFEQTNSVLEQAQTEANLISYSTARLWLDEVNEKIDAYNAAAAVLKSDNYTKADKEKALEDQNKVATDIKKILAQVQVVFNKPLAIETYSPVPVDPMENEKKYENLLRQKAQERKDTLATAGEEGASKSLVYDGILRLLDQPGFRNSIKSKDLAKVTDEDFKKMLNSIREQGSGMLSLIDGMRKQRINWELVIQDIHDVARKVDNLYGEGMFKAVGGFLFSSYSLDSKSKRITINGTTRRPDSKVFTFIADLVDSIEKSDKFKNIEFRTFSKSRDDSGNFSSSLNLDFSMQGEDEKDPRDAVVQ